MKRVSVLFLAILLISASVPLPLPIALAAYRDQDQVPAAPGAGLASPSASPTISVSPVALSSTQAAGTTVVKTLTIGNSGSASLNWQVYGAGASAGLATGGERPQPGDGGDSRDSVESDSSGASGTFVPRTDDVENVEPVSAPGGDTPVAPMTPKLLDSGAGAAASSTLLYDNGPLVNSPNSGYAGADESVLQTQTLGMGSYGFGHQVDSTNPENLNRIADDFSITDPAGWVIDAIVFYAYQRVIGSGSFTIDAVNYRIWDGQPGRADSRRIYGDDTTNRLRTSAWAQVYRVSESSTGSDTTRPVMKNEVRAGVYLAPGTYWLDWQSDGSLASEVFAPPIARLGVATTGNGLQFSAGTWSAALDTGSGTQQGFPFLIYGCKPTNVSWARVSPASGTTAAGASSQVSVTFDSTGLEPGTYTGTICVKSDDPNQSVVSVPLTLTVKAVDLSVTATDSPDPVLAGERLTYQATVRNSGGIAATGVTLVATLSPGVTYLSGTAGQGSCSLSGRTLTCALGTLNAGASVPIEIAVTVPRTSGTISSGFEVSSNEGDDAPSDNVVTVPTTIRLQGVYLPLMLR